MKIKAKLERKLSSFDLKSCVVEKVVQLSQDEFDDFLLAPLHDRQFITKNKDHMYEENGESHCLLVLGEMHEGGVLVEASGYDYPRYAAYIPGANCMISALAEQVADYVVEKGKYHSPDGHWSCSYDEIIKSTGMNISDGSGFEPWVVTALESREELDEACVSDGRVRIEIWQEYLVSQSNKQENTPNLEQQM